MKTIPKLFLTILLDLKRHPNDRTHYGLGKDAPVERPVQPMPAKGDEVIELSKVGGLHHRYEWRQAA